MARKFYFFFFVYLLLQFTSIYSQDFLEYEGKIRFVASSRFGKVTGEFKKVKVQVTGNVIGSQVIVDVKSIDTGNSMRDNHLKSEDFFDVEKYPQATLKVKSYRMLNASSFISTGTLTIKDKQKNISFVINVEELPNIQRHFGELEIDRTEFGINYNSLINPISEKVLVQFEIFVKYEK